jgi:1,4-dihydroxy-2-naphthoate octaprenyltransferase
MIWWIQAARLRTLPLATATVFFGAAGITWNSHNVLVVVLAWLTAVALQVFSNFANDWGDYKNGADNDNRIGPTRVMQSGSVTMKSMKRALVILGFMAFCLGIALLVYALVLSDRYADFFVFLAAGIFALWAAYRYTAGENPYGYKGFGDLFVFFFFGIASPVGVYYLLRFSLDWNVLLRVGFVGIACVMVLHLNNMRDRQTDEATGKRTVAVKLGFKWAKWLHFSYGIICLLSSFGLAFSLHFSFWSNIFFAFSALWLIAHLIFVIRVKKEVHFDSQLKVVALSTFVNSILFLFC